MKVVVADEKLAMFIAVQISGVLNVIGHVRLSQEGLKVIKETMLTQVRDKENFAKAKVAYENIISTLK